MREPRIRPAGDAGLLVEFDERVDEAVNARALALARALDAAHLDGVRDVVPTYRTVAVHFDPLVLDIEVLRTLVTRSLASPLLEPPGRTIEVPVWYGGADGPDLDTVAEWAGLAAEEVVARHLGVSYRVFMLGFLPGFAYLGAVDPSIAAPRRAVPRLRVPGGAVGIAGRQTGVYPQESPGGWQIVGRAGVAVFDPTRHPAALFTPGDVVRFVRGPADVAGSTRDDPGPPAQQAPAVGRSITVLEPGLLTTVQDAGRFGHQAVGVGVSGPLDRVSHRVANALAGNGPGAAGLEVTLAGPVLRFEAAADLAIAGAELGASLDGAPLVPNRVAAVRPGSVLRFGARQRGARAYLAVGGGVAVPQVLGSRATHVRARLGGVAGRPLRSGDRLPLGDAGPTRARRTVPTVARSGGARLRVLPGPQDDFFPVDALETVERLRFRVTTQSDRMGYRLEGGVIPRVPGREMISDATFPGGVQVPPSGQPILLLADRQTTGGYPQIATVITADLPLAGQLAPGDWVEFARCSRQEAIAALVAQEAQLLALE